MSFGANSILDMGRWALFASQVQLQVTGQNISNVNTEGYARRSVVLEEGPYVDYSPGQLGTGVKAKEVARSFDEMVESLYLEQASLKDKWGNLWEQLKSVENLLNESSGTGVSNTLSQYFNSWNEVSQRPENYGARQSVVNDAATLISTLKQVDADLSLMQQRINSTVSAQVDEANKLMAEISDLNKEIQVHHIEGQNNANTLLDERARKVRELGKLVDIKTIDNGGGNFTILTKSGQNLVDGASHFQLSFDSPSKTVDLRTGSTFEGNVYFDGSDDFEYTIEFVGSSSGSSVAGQVTSGADAAQFRVSLDGGVTWLTDDRGDQKLFSARDYDSRVNVEGLQIWFGDLDDQKATPNGTFQEGDRFVISPHQGLYWVENTSHREEITPQLHFNGEENSTRLTGGSIAAMLAFRDNYVGRYREKLDNLAEGIIWETNRRHSQGAGLQTFTQIEGTYQVSDTTKALASDSTGLAFGDRLQSGSSFVYVYNESTGLLTSSAALDFGGGATFDPNTHSLQDVADAFNNTYPGMVNATIVNNKLKLDAEDGFTFAMGTDSAGLMAGLGINTFFRGSSPSDMQINEKITSDLDYLATGHVNGAGEINTGDNTTALSMFDLREASIQISSVTEGTTETTLLDYYNGLVGNVGTDTNRAEFNQNFYTTLANDLDERQQQVAGVNLDEEMSDLIKYQASYTAAAKLITTADQMLQTILSLKP
ncbi:Flagellar hook-associated protein FlgK [Pseudodesulfovibrio profundus]|uniref:Flagellar hook-associated protein 1 n=1 Tax=Pseudodesulfovibrio profundus TaxID=57320 RepID=A0A2C8F4U0_9BACT|nr:flagellar hook-associated protein FlgK [Pseudodesulfovibrio profundus]MBC18019.1 flagellar hook-associated protein FlgK [Desulfovibrio sp.]SOB57621.1 Flagellar hook-associated protein FlgK [Pseudodesulfovibrio profundus]|tara:strand:+ start:8727 stop:10862 length:2136 start_codon:yes stop_codon:yes gene_type:complete